MTSGSSINSEAKNPLPPSSIYDTEVKTTDKNIFTDVPCEDYLEPITGGSLYSISEPLFTPSKTHKISFTNHNNNHHLKPTTPHSTPNTGTFNGDDNDIQIPKPFPRRKSLKKNLKDKKRSLSEEKESIEVFKESKKTSSSVDVLQSTSADNHIALNLVSESSLLFNGNSSHRTVHESSMSSQYRHHYVTLSPEYEFTYEESRVATRRFVNDTLDLVLTKAKQFLRVRNRHSMNESCADDWDILSHIPLTFEGLSGHRFEIFAASLKSDPVEAFSLMVLPEELDFELVSLRTLEYPTLEYGLRCIGVASLWSPAFVLRIQFLTFPVVVITILLLPSTEISFFPSLAHSSSSRAKTTSRINAKLSFAILSGDG